MSVAPHRWVAVRLFRLDPYVLLGVENSKRAMVLFAVVAAEDPQFILVQRRCMVLYLGSATDNGS